MTNRSLLHRAPCQSAVLLAALMVSWIFVPRSYSQERLKTSHYKSGPNTRRAFRDLMTEINLGTVRIFQKEKPVALGAIMSADGEILTKASELTGKVTCELSDGRSFPAEVVAVSREADIALLKISATKLPVIEWDRGPRPEVGQWFVTPGQKELPISVGIVSVANRTIPPSRGILGIQIEDEKDGPKIIKIFPNSGAAKAGLKVGDIVTNAAGKVVTTKESLSAQIRSLRPGDSLKLNILREKKALELLATLGSPEDNLPRSVNRGSFQNRLGGELSRRRAGFDSIIQHDSVLAPDECGGPVIGLSGKALGLNIARGGRTESYAMPAQSVLKIYEDLKAEHLAAQKTGG